MLPRKTRFHKKYLPKWHDQSREFNYYLMEIAQFEPLTNEEEALLSERIRKGDEEAFKTLVLANLRFVISVARWYANQGLSMGDLIAAGNIGLMQAARRFDGKRNFRFITYAAWWIRQGILVELANHAQTIRIPFNRITQLSKIGKKGKTLQQSRQQAVTPSEIAEELAIEEGSLVKILQICQGALSLDAPFRSETGTLYDILPDDKDFNEDGIDKGLNQELAASISSLGKREYEIIKLYFGIGDGHSQTLENIGRKLNLTRERVRQIKEKAIGKLRRSSHSSRLRDYY